jgi:hypothetical protein
VANNHHENNRAKAATAVPIITLFLFNAGNFKFFNRLMAS